MEALAWVVGIGGALYLLLRFPRPSLIFIGVVVAIGAAVGGFFYAQDQLAKRKAAKVVATVTYDLEECEAEKPLLVVMENGADEAVIRVRYWLIAYEPGYSDPVYQTDYSGIRSSFIIEPGTKAGGCHPLPPSERTVSANEADLLWKMRDVEPVFGEAP
ncbi:MAG TPA: hypothetical protein DIT67_13215 [Octadecabacter sp.]|nr:hypothetical protein [Octadecabacter sp.]